MRTLDLPGHQSRGSVEALDGTYSRFGFGGADVEKGVDVAFRIAKGRVSLNGVDYGPLAAGDRVHLTTSGELSVNGEARKPTTSLADDAKALAQPLKEWRGTPAQVEQGGKRQEGTPVLRFTGLDEESLKEGGGRGPSRSGWSPRRGKPPRRSRSASPRRGRCDSSSSAVARRNSRSPSECGPTNLRRKAAGSRTPSASPSTCPSSGSGATRTERRRPGLTHDTKGRQRGVG
jgi:hypothetical protein